MKEDPRRVVMETGVGLLLLLFILACGGWSCFFAGARPYEPGIGSIDWCGGVFWMLAAFVVLMWIIIIGSGAPPNSGG